jgi:hypothetical protein
MTIRKSIRVERPPEVSFRVFCEEITRWWPGGYGGKDASMSLETRLGGRICESRPTAPSTRSAASLLISHRT